MDRWQNIPQELRNLDRWVLWRYEQRGDRVTKVPYTPTGLHAKSTDPGTWATFDQVMAAAASFDGFGFVFSEHDPYTGCDFDAPIDAGKLATVHTLASYTERSPSGTGLHVIVRATLPGPGHNDQKAGREIYDRGRYFTMTGDIADGAPTSIEARQAEIDAYYATFKQAEPVTTRPPAASPVDLDDQTLLERMFASRSGAAILRLWNGDKSGYIGDDGKPNDSGADQALCNHLAFWTGADAARMDRLFRQSGLMRPKWDQRARTGETYGAGTIRIAIEGTPNTYQAPAELPEVIYPTGNAPVGDDARRKLLLNEARNDLGNATCVAATRGAGFLHTEAFGWLLWTGSHWQRDAAEAAVHGAVVDTLKARCILGAQTENTDLVKAAVPSAKHTKDALYHLRHMMTVTSSEFDAVPYLLNVKNGVVDLRNGEMAAHEPSNRFTYCIPVDYEPGNQSAMWEGLLLDWFEGNHEMALYVQRCLGYSATGEVREECAFYVHGPGRSGKGTLVNTVVGLLGADLARGIKFDIFTNAAQGDPQGFRWAPLRAARMISASESKKSERFNEGLLKQLTGRDRVEAAHKYHESFSFTPSFKIWLMSNHPPRGDVDDDAFWRRFRVIRMTKTYMGEENNTIKDALTRPENQRGLLAWLVFGAMRWYDVGLRTPDAIWQAVKDARDEQDTVGQWLADCTEAKPGIEVTLNDLFLSYRSWCIDSGIDHTYAKNTLSGKLAGKGYKVVKARRSNVSMRLVYGLQIL